MHQQMKILHANETYRLKASLNNEILCLDLCGIHKGFIQRSFSAEVCFSELPHNMKKNFSNAYNLLSFVSEPSFCKIDTVKGVINLCSTLTLPNGTTIELPTGEIKLTQYSKGKNEELYNIIPLVFSEHQLPNHQIKTALQLFCKTITDLTEQVYELKNNPAHVLGKSRVPEPKRAAHKNIESIKIPELANNLRTSTSGTEFCTTLNSSNQEEHNMSVDFDSLMQTSNVSLNIEDQIKNHTKQIDYLKTQLQENKSQMIKKISKMERKNVEIEKSIFKIMKELEEQREEISERSQTRHRNNSVTSAFYNSQQNAEEIMPATHAHTHKKAPALDRHSLKRYANEGNSSMNSNMLSPDSKLMRNLSFCDDTSSNMCESKAEYQSDTIDTSCTYINNFNVNESTATYCGEDWTKTQLLGKIPINAKSKFSIKINKTKRRYLWIGVADSSYKSKRWSWGLSNWIYYCGWNGKVYEGPDQNIKAQGTGFRQGQILDIEVDTEEGMITWSVDGEIRARHASDKLKNTSIKWVPLVKFFDRGDCVQWV